MVITGIKPAVKTAGRFNIFVDGKYSFSLDELQLTELGLALNQEISASELDSFKNESDFGKAYARALEYIFRRPRSVKELRDYAWRKKWEPDLAERVIERLQSRGYLDDKRFAEVWLRHRSLGKPMSKRRIILELKQKGVTADDIESSFEESDDFNEMSALRELVQKRRNRYDDPQKLIAYLARQGFSYDQIKEAMNEEEQA